MSHIKKRFQFHKVLEEYDFMKGLLENKDEKEKSDETILLLNSESLTYEGCERIFFMLRHILTLQTIILKSKENRPIVNEITKAHEAEKYKDGPVFYTKYALKTLYQAITDYLYNSDRIKILAFKNIPITSDLPILCQGIRSNRSIRVLHFEDCDICDDGCIQICQALRKSPIESLGLENCNISLTGASWLAWLIREQSMLRTLTTWNKYQNNYEYKTEQGVRKMVINDNPGIKDSGAKFIVSTLFDDNWVTHIHMQNTGLSDASCHLIFKLLRQNRSLTIFDIARNFISSNRMMEKISQALSITSTEIDNEITPKSVKKIAKKKKKNTKKKSSKISLDKLLSDKSQQTSEYSLNCHPFIVIDPYQQEKYNISLGKQNFRRNDDNFTFYNQLQKIFNDQKDKVKSPVIPKQYDPLSHLNTHCGVRKPHIGIRRDLQVKNKVKEKRLDFSRTSIDKLPNKRNQYLFQNVNEVKNKQNRQSRSCSSFKA